MFGWDNLCFKLICETNSRSGSERERVALAVKLIDSKGIEPREGFKGEMGSFQDLQPWEAQRRS